MGDQMRTILDEMNRCYTALSEVEAEVLVDTEGRLLNLIIDPTPSFDRCLSFPKYFGSLVM